MTIEMGVTGCSTCPLAGRDLHQVWHRDAGHGVPCGHPDAPKMMRINPNGASHAEGCPLWKDDVFVVAHLNEAQDTCCKMGRQQQDAIMEIARTGSGPVSREMLEDLHDFEVLDEDFGVTSHGRKVVDELKRGFGR